MSDHDPRPAAPPLGFSTRAIRAAPRPPAVDVSVGLEDLDDLETDLGEAIETAHAAVPALGAV